MNNYFMVKAFFDHGMAGELTGDVPMILGFYKTYESAEQYAKFAKRLLAGFKRFEIVSLSDNPEKWQITGIAGNNKQYKVALFNDHYTALEEAKTLINRYHFEEVQIKRLDLTKGVING